MNRLCASVFPIVFAGDNREIIVPNGAIYGGTITNYSARETRRVDMVFGIGYDDDLRKVEIIINAVLAVDEGVPSELTFLMKKPD